MRGAVRALVVVCVLVLGSAVALPAAQAADKPTAPYGMELGYAVYDRDSHEMVVSQNQHKQFRSASLVKLLIALDVLQTTGGTNKSLSDSDVSNLKWMLRTSNDDAASNFWVSHGWEQIVVRWAKRLGLADTDPPADRGMWGYTATSAADIVKVHRWILSSGPTTRTRTIIRDHLLHAHHCAADGSDQYFGIPQATTSRFSIKQGWSGFTSKCTAAAGAQATAQSDGIRTGQLSPMAAQDAASVDLSRPAMHTSGTIGQYARWVVVVLTLEPKGYTWSHSASRISSMTKQVYTYARQA